MNENSETKKINILLAEDQALVKESLKLMIETDDELKVTALASDGKEALDLCRQMPFDLAILDIRMPNMSGLEAAKVIAAHWPDIKILILTTFNDESYALEALSYGVSGYLLKTGDSAELIRSIKSAYSGGLVIEDHVAARILPKMMQDMNDPSSFILENHQLSERELDVVSCIGRGLNNEEISKELFLSVGTVKNMISKILSKLDLRDRTQIAIFAIHNQLIKESD